MLRIQDKTSAQVWLDIQEALEPTGLTVDDIQRLVSVSDEARNMTKALSDNMSLCEGKTFESDYEWMTLAL